MDLTPLNEDDDLGVEEIIAMWGPTEESIFM